MTADDLVRALELERVKLRPGRHMTPEPGQPKPVWIPAYLPPEALDDSSESTERRRQVASRAARFANHPRHRLTSLDREAFGAETPKLIKVRRRAYDRAREAAGQ